MVTQLYMTDCQGQTSGYKYKMQEPENTKSLWLNSQIWMTEHQACTNGPNPSWADLLSSAGSKAKAKA